MFFSFHLVVLLKWCRTVYKFNSNQVFTAWYQLCWLYWTINEHTCRRRGPFLFCGGTHVLDLFCPNHESMQIFSQILLGVSRMLPDFSWIRPEFAWIITLAKLGGGGTVPPISYAYVMRPDELKLWASKMCEQLSKIYNWYFRVLRDQSMIHCCMWNNSFSI